LREYWNAELETLAWSDVERWQAGQLDAALPSLQRRSRFYARLHGHLSDAGAMRSLADLAALP